MSISRERLTQSLQNALHSLHNLESDLSNAANKPEVFKLSTMNKGDISEALTQNVAQIRRNIMEVLNELDAEDKF